MIYVAIAIMLFNIMLVSVGVVALCLGKSINININHKQEFSESDRQLLEDIYNKDGDLKQNDSQDIQDSLDAMVKAVNAIMLDEENADG